MTKKIEAQMRTIRDSRYGFEMEAEQRGVKQGIEQGIVLGEKKMLYNLVRKGRLSIEEAAEEADLSPQAFDMAMKAYYASQAAALGAS